LGVVCAVKSDANGQSISLPDLLKETDVEALNLLQSDAKRFSPMSYATNRLLGRSLPQKPQVFSNWNKLQQDARQPVLIDGGAETGYDYRPSIQLSTSFSKVPYFNEASGEILVLVDESFGADKPVRIQAKCKECGGNKILATAQVTPGQHEKIQVSFDGLNESMDVDIEVTMSRSGAGQLAQRVISLRRVPDKPRGRVGINAKSRSLEVDGRPFLPVSWFTTLEHGAEVTLANLRDMAHRGVNSVMIYNLVPPPSSPKFATRGSPVHWMMLDACLNLGIKVHVYLLDFVDEITTGKSDDWTSLEDAVKLLRNHPAVLSWYLADDESGPKLPEVAKFIRELDPYHPISVSLFDANMATSQTYVDGADLLMVEVYGGDADEPYKAHRMSRGYPAEFMPQLTCGRAWTQEGDGIVISRQTFRSQLYHALLGGATGEVWFRYHEAKGWNNPGVPLLEASSVLGREMLELVPSLLSNGQWDKETEMPELTVGGKSQDGKWNADGVIKAHAFRESSGLVNLLMVNSLAEPMQAIITFKYGSAGIRDQASGDCVQATVPFEASAWKPRLVDVCNGAVSEWLPAWGVQVFRFNGSSSLNTAPPPSWPKDLAEFRMREAPDRFGDALKDQNLLVNPSFESSSTFVAAPDGWFCGMTDGPKGQPDSTCFADTSIARTGRHSGRFVTGANTFLFKMQPSTWSNAKDYDGWLSDGSYTGSVYAQADRPMDLLVVMLIPTGDAGHPDEIILAQETLTDEWKKIPFKFDVEEDGSSEPSGGSRIAFKVSKPGTIWLDDAELKEEGKYLDTGALLEQADRWGVAGADRWGVAGAGW